MTLTLAAALPLAALSACSSGVEAPSTVSAAPAVAPTPSDAPVTTASTVSPNPALPAVTAYTSPTCGCCASWAEHLRASGFPVETVDTDDLQAVKAEHGIPDTLQSCHTAVVDGYVVEGHVPELKRLLAERPEAAGLAVPGMPLGSPGMEQGDTVQSYDVLLVDDGQPSVFAHHGR